MEENDIKKTPTADGAQVPPTPAAPEAPPPPAEAKPAAGDVPFAERTPKPEAPPAAGKIPVSQAAQIAQAARYPTVPPVSMHGIIRRRPRERATIRAIRAMVSQFGMTLLVIAGVKIFIPADAFSEWPSLVMSAYEALPLWVMATLFLNTAMPDGTLRWWGYVLAVPVAGAALYAYDQLRVHLYAVFPQITSTLDIWSMEAIPVYALRPLALSAALLVLFVVGWKVAFGLVPWVKLRFWRLLSPVYLLVGVALCFVSAYFQMVNYAQIQSGAVYGMLFGNGPPAEATWYHLNPIANLVTYWTATPLETLVPGYFILGGMRMIRRSVERL